MENKIAKDIPFKRVNNPSSLVIGDAPDFFVSYSKGNNPVVFGVSVRNDRYYAGSMRSKTLQGLVNFHYKTCSVHPDNAPSKVSTRPR